MSTQNNKIYFSGLNSLRFWAAFLVIVSHIEMLKENYGFEIIISDFNFYYLGGISVTFFFVLSGFLITYLLLIEKEKHKNINIKAFYLRRILRIWPVYYSMLILAFFVLPHIEAFQESYFASFFEEHFTTNILLYLLILPNVSFAMYPAVPNIGQFWSIGVEEQFYLAWPLIIKKSKNILRTLSIILICIIGIKLLILLMGQFYEFSLWYFSLKRLVAMSKFECMCIGGIGAYWLFTENKYLRFLQKKKTLIITLVLLQILFVYVSVE
nr:acyltransferase [Pseudarcicella sp.]